MCARYFASRSVSGRPTSLSASTFATSLPFSTDPRAFIPNPDKKPFVNHVDGNKLNNNASNLEWVTASENQQHAIKLGLQKTGCERHNAKLLLEQIRDIRTNCVPGDPKLSFTAFAKKFNVNISTVSDAYHRITYKNVE